MLCLVRAFFGSRLRSVHPLCFSLSDLNNGFGDCRVDSPPSYLSSPRRKEPWKVFLKSPSEEGDLGGGIA